MRLVSPRPRAVVAVPAWTTGAVPKFHRGWGSARRRSARVAGVEVSRQRKVGAALGGEVRIAQFGSAHQIRPPMGLGQVEWMVGD